MDGLAAVEARISQIQARMASISAPTVPATAAARPFAAALTDAVAATAGTGGTTVAAGTGTPALSVEDRLAALRLRHTAASTSLTADGVPRALAAHGNGKVPATALEPIGHGGHRLWAPAAEAFGRMHAAAARDGIDIGVTDSYRSYQAQVDLAERKGLYSEGGLAAKPGTSDHGWGRALDLDLDSRAQAWMREHGGRYGFVEDTPREPWHWVFTPSR